MEIEIAFRVVDIIISSLALILSLVAIALVLGMKWSRQSVQLVPFDAEKAARDEDPLSLAPPSIPEDPSMDRELSELKKAIGLGDVNESYNDTII